MTSKPIRSFYDKFAKFDPKPPLADQPGTPGKKPNFDLDALPDTPPIKFSEPKKTSPPAKSSVRPRRKLFRPSAPGEIVLRPSAPGSAGVDAEPAPKMTNPE